MQAALAELQAALAHDAAGRRDAAAAAFTRLIALAPGHPGAHLRLAQFARDARRDDAAREHLHHAIAGARSAGLRQEAAPIFAELSILERRTGNSSAALEAARQGLQHCGEIAGLIWEECESLQALGDAPQRLHRLNRLALLQPDDPVILVELGFALLDTPSAPQALQPLRRAVERGNRDVRVALALASLELTAGDAPAAIARLEALLGHAQGAELIGVLGVLWFARRQLCHWNEAAALEARWRPLVEAGATHHALAPFMLLTSGTDPAHLLNYARRYNAAHAPAVASESDAAVTAPPGARRLRVGYLSADFHAHATAILMAGLFEAHSDRCEAFAYSYGPRVDDSYRTRLKAAIPNWRDVNDRTDADAAAIIAADALDVLVEMKGLTYGARPGIAARRPAPRIVHYLGHPGTIASAGVDWLVADAIVAPEDHAAFYAERVLRLPRCYQVNDSRRAHPPVTARAALGLRDDAIVLCNFNQAYKWSAPYFAIWFRALQEAPQAQLWLLDAGAHAREAITREAAAAGVAERLVWAPKLDAAAHLARLGAADLALDQLPYSSHTTAADALWMGVPLLSQLGRSFHERVGASLLDAVGLTDFVAPDLAGYSAQLVSLLREPSRLRGAQAHLRERRAGLPLFDTAGFARDWEQMLRDLCASPG